MARLAIDDERIEQFEAAFHGKPSRPDDSDADDTRAVENGIIIEHATSIAQGTDVPDPRSRWSANRNEAKCNA